MAMATTAGSSGGDVSIKEKALMNHVVLDAIFRRLDVLQLKVVRQVCSVWNDVAARKLGNATTLNCYLPTSATSTCCLKLAKRIHVKTSCNEAAVNLNFAKLLSHVENVVQQIVLDMDKSYIPSFVTTINSCPLLKLESMSMVLAVGPVIGEPGSPQQDWSLRPSLKCIEFQYGSGRHEFRSCLSYHSLFQTLVNSAPCAEELKIGINFYPDLTNFANLKVLKLSVVEDFFEDRMMVAKVLEHVKNSLVELELDFVGNRTRGSTPVDEMMPQYFLRTIPIMPNLTALSMDNAICKFMDFVDMATLPLLKHISASMSSCRILSFHQDLLRKLWKPHNGVSSLKFECQLKPRIMRKLIRLYPNVKNLELRLNMKGTTSDEFKELIKACTAWDMDIATIFVKSIGNLSVMAAVLKGLSAWKASKLVTLRMKRTLMFRSSEYSDAVKTAFMGCKRSYHCVEIVCGQRATSAVDEMRQFIRVNQLPIQIRTLVKEQEWGDSSDAEDYDDYNFND